MSNVAIAAPAGVDTDPLEDADLLMELCRALVHYPDQVYIDEVLSDDGGCNLTIRAANADLGQIIGKNGDTITLLRKLFGKIGAIDGRRISVFVLEPRRPQHYSKKRAFA
jgi:predicted RNA-binding protein YlqC (UPF0109 family)